MRVCAPRYEAVIELQKMKEALRRTAEPPYYYAPSPPAAAATPTRRSTYTPYGASLAQRYQAAPR